MHIFQHFSRGQAGNSLSVVVVTFVPARSRDQEKAQCSDQGSLSMARLPRLGTIGFGRHTLCLCLHRSGGTVKRSPLALHAVNLLTNNFTNARGTCDPRLTKKRIELLSLGQKWLMMMIIMIMVFFFSRSILPDPLRRKQSCYPSLETLLRCFLRHRAVTSVMLKQTRQTARLPSGRRHSCQGACIAL